MACLEDVVRTAPCALAAPHVALTFGNRVLELRLAASVLAVERQCLKERGAQRASGGREKGHAAETELRCPWPKRNGCINTCAYVEVERDPDHRMR